MPQLDHFDGAAIEEPIVVVPGMAPDPAGAKSTRLDWNRLIRHPRLEPIVRKLFPDQRRFQRLVLPNVVAYLGRAHASRPHRIADISVGGFRMMSDHAWTPGTEMTITLQREDWDGEESCQLVTVQARVVRCAKEETGFSIALLDGAGVSPSDALEDSLRVERETMEEFLANLQRPRSPRNPPVSYASKRPLLLSERTKILLELAGTYQLSAASEMWYSDEAGMRRNSGEPG